MEATFISIITILGTIGLTTRSFSQVQKNDNPVSELYQLFTEFQADEGSLSRFYWIRYSPERFDRLQVFYNDYLSKLGEIPFETLSIHGKVDHLLISKKLNNKLHFLSVTKKQCTTLEKWISFLSPIYDLEKQRRRG